MNNCFRLIILTLNPTRFKKKQILKKHRIIQGIRFPRVTFVHGDFIFILGKEIYALKIRSKSIKIIDCFYKLKYIELFCKFAFNVVIKMNWVYQEKNEIYSST